MATDFIETSQLCKAYFSDESIFSSKGVQYSEICMMTSCTNVSRDESSSEDSEATSTLSYKSSFRIRVSLQHYFRDVRERCFILVNRKRRVRWLERRLQRLFALNGKFYLISSGHWLPSSESLAVLNPDDSVEVLPQSGESVIELPERAMKPHEAISDNITDIVNKSITNNSNILNEELVLPKTDVLKSSETASSINGEVVNKENLVNSNNFCTNGYTPSKDCIDSSASHISIPSFKEVKRQTKTIDDDQRLETLKRQALAMLEKRCDDISEGVQEMDTDGPPPRRRRRVRKRTRRAATPPPDPTLSGPVEATIAPAVDVPEVTDPVATNDQLRAPISPAILRNETENPRNPRVVHSLIDMN